MQQTLIAGDSLNFSTCTPGYSAADGWQLLFRLAPLAVGGAVIDLTTAQDPAALDQHLCQAVPDTTATWAAGAYSWVSWVVRAGETYTIDQGPITIKPNPRTIAAGYDSRSLAVRTLEDLKTAYSGWTISKGNTRRYRIGDREREFKSAADIITDIRFWEQEVHQEEQAKARATGQATGNRFYIRHTR
jgi:hypothetical protein